jgi:hypothetical protein
MSPVPKMVRSPRGSLVGFLAGCFWGVRLRRAPITTDPLPSTLNRVRFMLDPAVIGLLVSRIGMITEACGGGHVFGFVSEFGRKRTLLCPPARSVELSHCASALHCGRNLPRRRVRF